MDELGFEGIPLPRPGDTPAVAPAPGPEVSGPDAVGPDAAASLTVRLAERLQRTHTRVLTAHQVIIAWQLARAARPADLSPAPAPPAHPPVPVPPSVSPPVTLPAPARRPGDADPVATILSAAARALRGAGAGPFPGSAAITWLDETPELPGTAPRVERDGEEWRIGAGQRTLAVLAPHGPRESWPEPPVRRFPPDPRPLARATVTRLNAADLDALAAGDIARVLGAAFGQSGRPPAAPPAPWPARLLETVTLVDPRGGRSAQGLLHATTRLPDRAEEAWPHCVAAALELLRVHAFHQGLHLCLPGARATLPAGRPVLLDVRDAPAPPGAELRLAAEITATGMLPRPYATADCEITAAGRPLARLRDVGVVLKEGPGEDALDPVRPSLRTSVTGKRVVADELHTAIFAEGDLGIVPLPGSTARVTGRVRPRLPRGDFRMLDRVVDGHGEWDVYRPGSWGLAEYDVPADPWYVRENGGTMPQLALMETALQAAGLFSGMLGVAGAYPDEHLSCRNLDGRARLIRHVDAPGTTVEQHVTLRSHSPLPGGVMHRYDFRLGAGGEPFYEGEAVHGFFTPELLAEQQGLDAGTYRPPWLERHPPAPADVRRLDLHRDLRLGRGRLALLEDVTLVPGGGDHGAGYVLCDKPVRRDDWFFDHHFFRDPVMPGSAGVQMLYQAVHAYALHTGLLDHLVRPRSHIAVGEELHWSYRGQILREHRRVRGEAHIREVRREDRRVLLRADGSVWRDDLRIYQVDNIAADIRGEAA
ncbi:3-hydroxyacyl-ACP dehydratase [Streptomyces sp. NPDC001678]|uniref:3-hydroxyacyl-ACP dehydratase n=1 Tax=Streptomyces sp. NPDC001678 TaxID=3364599 RepID=UPI00367BE8AE